MLSHVTKSWQLFCENNKSQHKLRSWLFLQLIQVANQGWAYEGGIRELIASAYF